MLDFDPLLLYSIQRQLDYFQQQGPHTIEGLIKWVQDGLYPPHLAETQSYLVGAQKRNLGIKLVQSGGLLGRHFAFNDEASTEKVRCAVDSLPVVPVYMDFTNPDSLVKLGELLARNNARVGTLNLSNLFDYFSSIKQKEPFTSALKGLPFAKDALCVGTKLLLKRDKLVAKSPESFWSKASGFYGINLKDHKISR